MGDCQALQQMREDEQRKDATIKLLEKTKRLKDKQLKQAQQCADQATETLAEAVRQSSHLAQLVVLCFLPLPTYLLYPYHQGCPCRGVPA